MQSSSLEDIRKMFLGEHFMKVGFIYGMRWVDRKSGVVVSEEVIENFIKGDKKCLI